jgi:hypothetical protein
MLGKFEAFGYDYDVGFFIDEETFFLSCSRSHPIVRLFFLKEQGE